MRSRGAAGDGMEDKVNIHHTGPPTGAGARQAPGTHLPGGCVSARVAQRVVNYADMTPREVQRRAMGGERTSPPFLLFGGAGGAREGARRPATGAQLPGKCVPGA